MSRKNWDNENKDKYNKMLKDGYLEMKKMNIK